ncbi:MAG: glycosyltransferase [Chloroflexota bacterium]|nr:glycosyltransferase [Chloroflexota bacterium]
MTPRISVVTPTLNAARFLPSCLASLRAQRYPMLEHIVVDGGSTDGTRELARDVVWLSAPGSNQAQAINTGLRLARGEVVAWLNADDAYTVGALALVAACFAADPDLEVLYGDCDVVDERGRLLWQERPGPYDFERLLRRGNYLAQPAVFLRRRLLDRVGYLDESFEYGMDYELWLRLDGCRVQYVPRVLAMFCWRPGSKTARGQLGNWRELLRAARRHGGGWTLPLAWSFSRMLVTLARVRLTGQA